MPGHFISRSFVLSVFVIVVACATFLTTTSNFAELKKVLGYHEDNLMNFTQLATKYGYTVQEHSVITEDGYILTIFRMQSKKCNHNRNIPVLLMHGVFLSADVWLDAGPHTSLAYLLADDCHDLWVGSNRGTNYGRNHITLDPDADSNFWDYSTDEMGLYDIPAMLDHIINTTKANKLNYIGYSQGAGQLFMTLSERVEYNNKINKLFALAPATKIDNMQSVSVRILFKTYYLLRHVYELFGAREIIHKNSMIHLIPEFVCQFSWAKDACVGIISAIDNYNPGSMSDYTVNIAFSHLASGCSLKQILKYRQMLDDGSFGKYDYGSEGNLLRYNSTSAPHYELSNVLVPSVVFTSVNDRMVTSEDVIWLVKQLPNLVGLVNVTEIDKYWNHADMVYSRRWPTVYPKLQFYLND